MGVHGLCVLFGNYFTFCLLRDMEMWIFFCAYDDMRVFF